MNAALLASCSVNWSAKLSIHRPFSAHGPNGLPHHVVVPYDSQPKTLVSEASFVSNVELISRRSRGDANSMSLQPCLRFFALQCAILSSNGRQVLRGRGLVDSAPFVEAPGTMSLLQSEKLSAAEVKMAEYAAARSVFPRSYTILSRTKGVR
jgi:hypothetical protein